MLREIGPELFRPAPFFRPVVRQTRPRRDKYLGKIYVTVPTATTAVNFEVTPTVGRAAATITVLR